jgi:hypothetical protein
MIPRRLTQRLNLPLPTCTISVHKSLSIFIGDLCGARCILVAALSKDLGSDY